MTDREIFRDNLNYYLKLRGKMQKDLAEYVGAKTATVSGWTRGISFPRADAMEKIAMFFGIPTSALITERDTENSDPADEPKNEDIRILVRQLNKLSPEQLEQAKAMFKVMFAPQYNDMFTKEEDR